MNQPSEGAGKDTFISSMLHASHASLHASDAYTFF
jgi:hypothetical protein